MERKVKKPVGKPSIDSKLIKKAVRIVKVEYLKIDQLKAGYLYKIIARNANYGIWLPQKKSFIISRVKFGENYLFEEYHWDCEAFATVKPLEEIEKSPFNADKINIEYSKKGDVKVFGYPNKKAILEYLNKFEPKVHFFQLLSKEEQDEIRRNRTWEDVY